MSVLIKFIKQIDLTNYTLIIPSVSVGNIPQLTVDLIISTFNFHRTGIIWHPAVVPSVGGDPFKKDSAELTTACELYASEALKTAVIQLRSSIELKYALSFFEALVNKIKALKFKNLVILASDFAQEMHDVKSPMYRYLSSGEVVPATLLAEYNFIAVKEEGLHSGIGFALKLYKIAIEKSLSTILLAKYTSEGDNWPESVQTLLVINKLFMFFKGESTELLSNVKIPNSWDHVFGNPSPPGIY